MKKTRSASGIVAPLSLSMLIGSCAATLCFVACGGSGSAPATQEGVIVPCNDGQAASDVWQIDFDPKDRAELLISVDTKDVATAAEYRLIVVCNDEVEIDTFEGQACSNPPPSLTGGVPSCPLERLQVADIDFTDRIVCQIEITPTEPLGVGDGGCADAGMAEYKLRATIDGIGLGLDLLEDDCRTSSSCLEDLFDVER